MTASTSKDTLISINKNDVDLLNKVMLSENFYRSMYDVNDDKIKLFDKKIVTLEEIIKRDEVIMKELQDNVYLLEYDLSVSKENELTAREERGQATISAYEWMGRARRRTLLGIPISLAGGFLIATLIQH